MRTDSTTMRSPSPLRAVRTARGLGLRTVAARAGIDPGHLSKVERGEKQLSLESLYRLAVVLELRELAAFLEPYIAHRDAVAAPVYQPGAATGNDEEAGYQPASPVEQSAPTAK